jgi:hypothetical protein
MVLGSILWLELWTDRRLLLVDKHFYTSIFDATAITSKSIAHLFLAKTFAFQTLLVRFRT